jgi:hypothetical protein
MALADVAMAMPQAVSALTACVWKASSARSVTQVHGARHVSVQFEDKVNHRGWCRHSKMWSFSTVIVLGLAATGKAQEMAALKRVNPSECVASGTEVDIAKLASALGQDSVQCAGTDTCSFKVRLTSTPAEVQRCPWTCRLPGGCWHAVCRDLDTRAIASFCERRLCSTVWHMSGDLAVVRALCPHPLVPTPHLLCVESKPLRLSARGESPPPPGAPRQ